MTTSNPPRKVRRQKVKIVDEIIESLRQDIVLKRLANGDRLPTERELAERFGVSQPTVREAIRALEMLGLIEVHHGSGSFVSGHSHFALASALQTYLQFEGVSILDVLAVRQILGRQSAGLAAEHKTAADLKLVADALRACDEIASARDVEEVINRIVAFQRAVSACAHNPLLHSLEVFLVSLLIQIQVKALRKQGPKFWRERASEFQHDRQAIFTAISAGDRDQARSAIDQYFERQKARFVDDDLLNNLSLADPRFMSTVAEIVRRSKEQ